MNSKEKTKFRTTKEWRAFREQILADRNYTCEICGIRKTKMLNIHHKDESNYTDLNTTKFSVLCAQCHKELERLLKRKAINIDEYAANMKRIFDQSKSFR